MAVRYTTRSRPQATAAPTDGGRFAHAVTLHGAGHPGQALTLYAELLRERPADAKLAELAGIACMQLARYREAVSYLQRAEQRGLKSPTLFNNLGVSHKNVGELGQALRALRLAVDLQPDYPEAQAHLGAVLEESGAHAEAAAQCLRALAATQGANAVALDVMRRLVRQPQLAGYILEGLRPLQASGSVPLRELVAVAQAYAPVAPADMLVTPARAALEHAAALLAAGDAAGAASAYELYLQGNPANAPAWNNLGLALGAAGDGARAVEALRRATTLDASLAYAWSNLGGALVGLGRHAEAREALAAALQRAPRMAGVHANLGMLQRAEGDVAGAMQHYAQALRLDPDHYEAHLNLGNLRQQFGDEDGARGAFEQALRIRPQEAEASYSVGIATADPAAAAVHLERALSIRPAYAEAEIARAFNQLKACDWRDLDARLARVEETAADPQGPALAPFWTLALSGSRRTQLVAARKWARARMPHPPAPAPAVTATAPARGSAVRVGLLSGDLRDHAVGQLLRDVLPRVDAGNCELWAYDASPEDGSAVRADLLGACREVRAVHALGAEALAGRIRADGIDVLVDLAGFSQHSRSPALAWRPAPVQVSWLGYPGSMGWDAVDVLLADDFLVPAPHEQDYDERIVRLPLCYQPARRFVTGAARPTRAEAGLPEHALVFAAFANSYKLRPALFHCWLRLLAEHPGSVLWLARYHPVVEENLRLEARHRGIDAARLVFAPVVELDRHLARLPLADLCLDTAPYGSGVTATQAVCAGVPLLTLAGETYVGRMAASLLHALDLPALVASDLDDYAARALLLAGDAGLRMRMREALTEALSGGAALDVARSARDLEHTFIRLAQAGQATHQTLTRQEIAP